MPKRKSHRRSSTGDKCRPRGDEFVASYHLDRQRGGVARVVRNRPAYLDLIARHDRLEEANAHRPEPARVAVAVVGEELADPSEGEQAMGDDARHSLATRVIVIQVQRIEVTAGCRVARD